LQSYRHGSRSFRQQDMKVTVPTGIAAMTVSNARCTSSVVVCAWCQPPDNPTIKSSTCNSKLKPKKRHISCMHTQTSKSCAVQTNKAEMLWSLTLVDILSQGGSCLIGKNLHCIRQLFPSEVRITLSISTA